MTQDAANTLHENKSDVIWKVYKILLMKVFRLPLSISLSFQVVCLSSQIENYSTHHREEEEEEEETPEAQE